MAVRVFLTTENLVSWPRETRSCLSCATVSPRYSVRTAAFDSLKSLVISATAETLLGVAITLLPGIVPVCPGPRSKELKTKKRPAQMHGACLDAVHDRRALLRSPAPAALCSGSFVRKSTALSRRDCRSESCLGEWISNNRRSLVLQAYGTRRACSKSGPAGRGSAGLHRKTLAPDVGPGPQLTAGPKLRGAFRQRPNTPTVVKPSCWLTFSR